MMRSFYSAKHDGRLRYHDLPGDGIPLIFFHGLGCASSCDYPAVAADERLRGRRILLVDFLGSGFSDRPESFAYTVDAQADLMAVFIRHLGVEKIDLFGHSMGGTIAIETAYRLGAIVDHLMLGEPNLEGGGGTFSRQVAGMAEADYVAHGHDNLVQAAAADGNDIWARSMAVSAPYAVHRGAASLVAGSDPLWRDRLFGLTSRRTMIFGERSLPDPDMQRMKDAGVGVQVVADAGHSMAWENPAGLAAAIKAALG
ncbi:alpha/beta fold hydrolase [Kordiimonas marina]|uniref:alpha/beta fold hydrolase n=1 Tax=Kordiimonas marina TaxID=2872312 RepID=UPI001FF21C61|nr:alpha/beta hydrolase [Kordiimonas marina]MCJ9428163.1 alpha/beta hydrolase [Kordiimonas marina]